MPVPEQENYIKLNKDIYYLTVNDVEKYFFRNPSTVIALQNLFLKSNQYLHNYKVVSNLDTITVNTCCFDYNSGLGSQNMHYSYSKPEIWHLNSGNSAYSPVGSRTITQDTLNLILYKRFMKVVNYLPGEHILNIFFS